MGNWLPGDQRPPQAAPTGTPHEGFGFFAGNAGYEKALYDFSFPECFNVLLPCVICNKQR